MFSLEIGFKDGISENETIFVRRPQALIGPSDYAHVSIEDMRELPYQLRVMRGLGRSFRCKAVGGDGSTGPLLDDAYEGFGEIDLGNVKLMLSALDSDVLVRDGEPPDRAGVRVLRQCCAHTAPTFPAVVIQGADPVVVSFAADQVVTLGRSRQCTIRLDSADISSRHARLGYERGEFWVEDLGSTNGTFVNRNQVSGRVNIASGTPVVLGREVVLIGVTSEDQIKGSYRTAAPKFQSEARVKYPILISISEVARPAKFILKKGAEVTVGREPKNDLWLGAPHISRKHCVFKFSEEGKISITDHSTNGTAYHGGVIKKGDTLDVDGQPLVLDFGGGVTLGLCFSEDQERAFVAAQGAAHVFRGGANEFAAESTSLPAAPRGKPVRVLTGVETARSHKVKLKPVAYGEKKKAALASFVDFLEDLGKLRLALVVFCLVSVLTMAAVLIWHIFV